MRGKFLISIFRYSSGVMLIITAVAKIISAFGSADILDAKDPILIVSFKNVFLVAGGVEFFAGIACLFVENTRLWPAVLAWLSSSLLLYRIGLLWINYQRPCPCLGNLTSNLGVSPIIADMALKVVLVYLLIGSYATLFWRWRQRREQPGPSAAGRHF